MHIQNREEKHFNIFTSTKKKLSKKQNHYNALIIIIYDNVGYDIEKIMYLQQQTTTNST